VQKKKINTQTKLLFASLEFDFFRIQLKFAFRIGANHSLEGSSNGIRNFMRKIRNRKNVQRNLIIGPTSNTLLACFSIVNLQVTKTNSVHYRFSFDPIFTRLRRWLDPGAQPGFC